jgi:UDP-N-acetylglucosamine 2-epimerase
MSKKILLVFGPHPKAMKMAPWVKTLQAQWHFAPTAPSCRNLVSEGFPPDAIHVTGNFGYRDPAAAQPYPFPSHAA